MPFSRKDESELARLDEDSLFAYMVEARDAGEVAEARRAAARLCFGRERQIRAYVRMSVDSEADVEDVTATILEQAIKARFDGGHPGQFFSLVNTIRDRRIADHLEANRRRREAEQSIAGGEGEDLEIPADHEPVDLRLVLEDCLATQSDRNRMVVELRIDGHRAGDVAELVRNSGLDGDMTPANVDQIFARFKRDHRETLLGGRKGRNS